MIDFSCYIIAMGNAGIRITHPMRNSKLLIFCSCMVYLGCENAYDKIEFQMSHLEKSEYEDLVSDAYNFSKSHEGFYETNDTAKMTSIQKRSI